jgi:hypothetical protein
LSHDYLVNLIEARVLVEPEEARDAILVLKLDLITAARIVVVGLSLGLPNNWSNRNIQPARFYQLAQRNGLKFFPRSFYISRIFL